MQRRRIQEIRWASTTSTPTQDIYDVVCVGGGPAGLSLLAGLRASPLTSKLKVALIESQDLRKTHSRFEAAGPFSNRCSSLTPSSVSNLKAVGAWDFVEQSRVQAYQEMEVWDGVSGSNISFDWMSAPQNLVQPPDRSGNIACMIENNNLTKALFERLSKLGGTSIFSPVRVDSIDLGGDLPNFDMQSWPLISLSDGSQIAARLLVGADGANSPVRTFSGIQSRGWDYRRHGVVATLHLAEQRRNERDQRTAYQRFLPSGPVALLPLPGSAATLVWSTTPERAARLKSLASEDFVALVNGAFRLSPTELTYMHELERGQVEEVAWRESHSSFEEGSLPKRVVGVEPGTIASFPLKMRHADSYIGERVALIGDAAHTIHPLAGQGLNQGQGDAASLVRTIEHAVQHGADIGSQQALEAFQGERYAANNLLMGVVDKLHKLYQFESGPIVPLRTFGLATVNKFPTLKRLLMRTAAGAA
jgi:ubiquinone biosynthesis monooxygenase Coq6